MKDNKCKTIAFDCLVNDLMCASEADSILTEEGYNSLKEKYAGELDEFVTEMAKNWGYDETYEAETYEKSVSLPDNESVDKELPFS